MVGGFSGRTTSVAMPLGISTVIRMWLPTFRQLVDTIPRGVGTEPRAHSRPAGCGATRIRRIPSVAGRTPNTQAGSKLVGPLDQPWPRLAPGFQTSQAVVA